MRSWKTYLWVNGISNGVMLFSAGLAAWLYFLGSASETGWIVLAQVVSAIGCTSLFALTHRSTRQRLEQARADARLPAWRPSSAKLDW